MQVVNGVTKGDVATGHPRRLSYVANNVNKRDYKRAEGTQQSIDHLKKIIMDFKSYILFSSYLVKCWSLFSVISALIAGN